MTTKSSGSCKFGRASRSPAHTRYTAGNRRFENQLRREYRIKYRYRQRVSRKHPVGE